MNKTIEKNKLFPKLFLNGIAVVIILVVVLWSASYTLSDASLSDGSDAGVYVRMAYHIFHHRTVSGSRTEPPVPTNRREPGFSAYLAMMMRFDSELQNVSVSEITTTEGGIERIRRLQLPLLAAAAVGAGVLAFMLTGQLGYGYMAMLLTGFSNGLIIRINSMYRELFMGLILLIVAILLVAAIRRKKPWIFGLLGLALAGMVLTNAIYQYFIVVLIAGILYLYSRQVFEKKQVLLCLGLLLAGYIIPTGAWMIRNYHHFGRFYITDRAGDVMAIRAEYNKMTADEYWGAFVYWTPDPFFQRKSAKVMQLERRWLNLHRSNREGYYATAKALTNFLEPGETFENASERDKVIQKRALGQLLRHPLRHLAATLPFAWRGIFFEYGYLLSAPINVMVRSVVVVNVLYFASLFYWFVHSLRKRQWEILGVTLLCVYLFGLNSFFSHNIPRYNQPILPLLAVLFTMSVCRLLKRDTDTGARPIPPKKKR